jgi:sugar lactone lactonase YvrE
MRITTFAVALIAATASHSAANADAPKAEVVVEWNSVPYDVKNPKIADAWRQSKIYGKALLQGAKVDSQGAIYASTARWAGTEIPATLSKLVQTDGKWVLEPFPSEELNDPANPKGLKAVLGFEIDQNDVMWILDQGHIAGAASNPGDEKLLLWDLKANKEIQRYEFSEADLDRKCSFLNDIAVDSDSGFAYITDSGVNCNPLRGGLIVYDSKSDKARRVLDQTMFTNNDPNFFFNIDNRPVLKGSPMLTGADGIALSDDKSTLYWTNLTGNTLWSLDTVTLRNGSLSEPELQARVKRVTSLPSNTDGITADRDGNLYLTALQLNGIMKFDTRTGRLERFVHHPEMSWPDTLAWGPDGALYVVSNHLNIWVDGDMNFDNPATPNFRIWKFQGVGKR